MKDKHIQIRIEQCLVLAKASHCPRRKLGAMLLDPERNVVLADGYNGGPRGGQGPLCGGYFCERDGFDPKKTYIERGSRRVYHSRGVFLTVPEIQVHYGDTKRVQAFTIKEGLEQEALDKAKAWLREMEMEYPPIPSGTHIEKGCHHAEMNVLMNAAAHGIATKGAWMIVLAEPCIMCAKLIHHAGIEKIIVVDGGYAGGKAGVQYLRKHGVEVQEVKGPKDPRLP